MHDDRSIIYHKIAFTPNPIIDGRYIDGAARNDESVLAGNPIIVISIHRQRSVVENRQQRKDKSTSREDHYFSFAHFFALMRKWFYVISTQHLSILIVLFSSSTVTHKLGYFLKLIRKSSLVKKMPGRFSHAKAGGILLQILSLPIVLKLCL
jgi:hypothetical protein